MKATSLLEIRLLQKSDVNKLSFFLKQHGTHHYQLDRLFYLGKANEYVADLIYDFSLQNDVWVVKGGKDIKGLIGFRRRKWDSEYFGYPVASIDYFFMERGDENAIIPLLLMARFDEWNRKHANSAFAVIGADAKRISMCLWRTRRETKKRDHSTNTACTLTT